MPQARELDAALSAAKVLIVDDEPYIRKVLRALLTGIGVKKVYEAGDVPDGLQLLCNMAPDIVLLDWEMPGMNGAEFMRFVRQPESCPMADVPVIMVTASAERSRVVTAVQLGVNEYLLKPVSSQALRARLASVLINPRPMIRRGAYYGPEPRKLTSYKPELEQAMAYHDRIVLS